MNASITPQSLRDLAVLIGLRMTSYSPRAIDKAETAKYLKAHGATGGAKVIRDCLAGTRAADVLDKISKAQGEARRSFYARSLPWDDSGRRMASNEHAYELLQELQRHAGIINALAAEFGEAWKTAGDEARASLNGLWKAEDYKTPAASMVSRFTLTYDVEPMPQSRDLRLDVPDAMLTQLMQQSEDRIRERFAEGCREAHTRLMEAIEAIHAKLSDPKAIFRDSLIGNLRELLNLLPALNIAKDAELDRIGKEARARLCKFPELPAMFATEEPATETLCRKLRDDPAHRAKVAAEAGAILRDMRAYLTPQDKAA